MKPSDLLQDLRAVFNRRVAPPEDEQTPGEPELWKMKANDYKGFLKLLHEQEKSFNDRLVAKEKQKHEIEMKRLEVEKAAAGASPGEGAPVSDERALEVAEMWLKEQPGV